MQMTHPIYALTCPIRVKHAGLSLIVQKIMIFRLKYLNERVRRPEEGEYERIIFLRELDLYHKSNQRVSFLT
jgi:hypothetical protein